MSECSHNCGSCSANCSSREKPESFQVEPHEMSAIKNVVAVVSGKGGVGKSLITSLLACATQRSGYNTAILDADITGPSIPKAFGLTERLQANEFGITPATTRTGISAVSINLRTPDPASPVIWRGPVIASAVTQFWKDVIWSDVDFMYVDMPPGTGDVPLTVFQSLPIKGIVVVATPQDLVSLIVEKAIKMAEMMNVPVLALVENMSYYQCDQCGARHEIFGKSHIEDVAQKYGIDTIVKMPIDPTVAAKCDLGKVEDIQAPEIDELFKSLRAKLEEKENA